MSGTGITGLSPAFDAAVTRYSVYTADGQDGQLTVTATTADPQGLVSVNGIRVSGATTLSGLHEGDEVSVIISDSSGTTGYALLYLPPDFPDLTASVDTGTGERGQVLLTLTDFAKSRTFEVAVDHNGVPSYFHADDGPGAMDLKPAPHGHYTVLRPNTQPGRTGSELVELDGRFRPIRTMTVADPLTNTDNHDAILRADGSRLLMGYEPNRSTGRTDATIQEVDARGQVVYTWNSGDHFRADETTAAPTNPDYAHINSFQELPDGDLLVSFRHTSSIMKIAWRADRSDGHSRGDILWRLGGRYSDFAFPDDADGGPCAQHTAGMLDDGHILVFENGSGWPDPNPLCVNPADRTGASIARPHTRIAEYALAFDGDGKPAAATLVWKHDGPSDGFTLFTGSTNRLPGGDTFIGWGALRHTIASEVTADNRVVWELSTTTQMVSYRAVKADVPDVTPPVVAVGLRDHLTVEPGTRIEPGARCTDQGGSTLARCTTTSDTSLTSPTPGSHTVRVEAVDGAGNRTVVTRAFVVRSGRTDLKVRSAGVWGEGGAARLPKRGVKRSFTVRLANDRVTAGRLALQASGLGKAYRVHYLQGGHDVTRSVRAGTWRATLAGGASVDLTVVVERIGSHAPRIRTVTLRAVVPGLPATADVARLVIRSHR
ncbi:aryl-sulfate sulfotransferase [Nocardioides sp. CER19]|uniref:aryl-sulfate sulfotransferase n=1 Tax=Nocardioides sp. CER19 TaxID=3038538 RepID=UPI00244BBE46|nr:aryl-sulfate sulfotransferase [Nocardioides sp. CER19]MDH2416627.1 aryl-sulfate sulfotransferase [Nocardioides sp. CER19]